MSEGRWAIDDHIVNQGDGDGRWFLYDLHAFNDPPPCAEFYSEEEAKALMAYVTNLERENERLRKDRIKRQRAADELKDKVLQIIDECPNHNGHPQIDAWSAGKVRAWIRERVEAL